MKSAAICRRCGREQPALFSPCPECLVGSASSIPQTAADAAVSTDPLLRGGEVEPTRLMSRELGLAFAAAHRAWAEAKAPWLLEEWLNA
jgi:hypothetical protein